MIIIIIIRIIIADLYYNLKNIFILFLMIALDKYIGDDDTHAHVEKEL